MKKQNNLYELYLKVTNTETKETHSELIAIGKKFKLKVIEVIINKARKQDKRYKILELEYIYVPIKEEV